MSSLLPAQLNKGKPPCRILGEQSPLGGLGTFCMLGIGSERCQDLLRSLVPEVGTIGQVGEVEQAGVPLWGYCRNEITFCLFAAQEFPVELFSSLFHGILDLLPNFQEGACFACKMHLLKNEFHTLAEHPGL